MPINVFFFKVLLEGRFCLFSHFFEVLSAFRRMRMLEALGRADQRAVSRVRVAPLPLIRTLLEGGPGAGLELGKRRRERKHYHI